MAPTTIDLSGDAKRTIVVLASALIATAPEEVTQAVTDAVAIAVTAGATPVRVEVEHVERRPGGHVLVAAAGERVVIATRDVLIGFRSTAQPDSRDYYGLPPR